MASKAPYRTRPRDGNLTMILLETAITLGDKSKTWQGTPDTDSLYILIASLLLAFIAFVILMRVRW
jgi:hypothetical protein